MSEKLIVSLDDVRKIKNQKEAELVYYKNHLEDLQRRITWLEADLKLTNQIINMIEKENIIPIE